MRRLTMTVYLCFALLVVALQPADASVHDGARPASLWQSKQWVRWALGSNSNPFLNAASCGEPVGRMFFVTGSIEAAAERTCRIPEGMPLLVSPGGTAFWASSPDTTDQDLIDLRDADFPLYTDERVTLDGVDLSLEGTVKASPGVYGMPVGRRSFIRTVDPSFPAEWRRTRVASTGGFLLIAPPSPGKHVLVLYDEYVGSPFSVRIHFSTQAS